MRYMCRIIWRNRKTTALCAKTEARVRIRDMASGVLSYIKLVMKRPTTAAAAYRLAERQQAPAVTGAGALVVGTAQTALVTLV